MSEPTAGRWTTEPPTVPGWYWWRDKRHGSLCAVHIKLAHSDGASDLYCLVGYTIPSLFAVTGSEWYTIQIQEPPK